MDTNTLLQDFINERSQVTHQTKEEKERILRSTSKPEQLTKAQASHDTFVRIWNDVVLPSGRNGAERVLPFLESSDFFIAPASTSGHEAYVGGLCLHSIRVYACLADILREGGFYDRLGVRPSEDSIAVMALLHDLCKVNFYNVQTRNKKNDAGRWEPFPYFSYDDAFPYGHGEKSVYLARSLMRLSTEEAVAIRFHMGFSNMESPSQRKWYSGAASQYPLATALSEADSRAAFFLAD